MTAWLVSCWLVGWWVGSLGMSGLVHGLIDGLVSESLADFLFSIEGRAFKSP